jgi:fatty acid desaturase
MYSEMPQKIAKLDQAGNAILDENGEPVMVSNDARSIWITATTLITALHLGIITYVFSGLIVLLGLISIWTGIIFRILKKRFFPASAN